MTASEANLPTLAKKYYSLDEKGPFGLISRTFKFICSHNENTQFKFKYLISSAQSSSRLFNVLILEQTYSCRAPIQIQDDFYH